MPTALAIRHVPFEDLGTLEPLLQSRGYNVEYLDACVDDMTVQNALAPDLLIVLGGPIGAFDEDRYPFLIDELALIERRLAAGAPLLGICLGAQLTARALGAHVAPMGVSEIGFAPLTLSDAGRQSPLAALGDTPVLHWHGDQFDIPAGAQCLAGTAVCPHQAFSLGRQVLGLQFHLEADAGRIERWLVGHAGELALHGIDPRALRTQAQQDPDRLASAAANVIGTWLDELEPHNAR